MNIPFRPYTPYPPHLILNRLSQRVISSNYLSTIFSCTTVTYILYSVFLRLLLGRITWIWQMLSYKCPTLLMPFKGEWVMCDGLWWGIKRSCYMIHVNYRNPSINDNILTHRKHDTPTKNMNGNIKRNNIWIDPPPSIHTLLYFPKRVWHIYNLHWTESPQKCQVG